MLIPSLPFELFAGLPSLSRRVNANSQLIPMLDAGLAKLIKKGEC